MAQGLAQFWNDWGIQILVLLSFTLQMLLLMLAGIRRRKSSAPLRLLLWLMYQLADSTAIYTLGHLSVAGSKARDPHLVAFWAPFLLVHLGGPGNITAYALEDNRLWLRHLLTLSVQVLGAAFVIYKYVAVGGRTLLLVAAVLVFIVGVLKYGWRTGALWRGNLSNIRSTVKYPQEETEYNLSHWGKRLRWPYPRAEGQDKGGFGDEELLLGAHCMFHICKSMFADAALYHSKFNEACGTFYCAKDSYRLAEMQLSLMYDVLYTKAAVIHTWYGYGILVISPLLTAAALFLFHYDSSRHGTESKGANVVITYVLLSGTLALETLSLARAIGSTWACALMYCYGWEWLLGAVTFLRRLTGVANKRRWSGSMGQYNLLHVCTRDRTKLGTRLAARLGLGNWWNKVHYSGATAISTTDLMDRLLKLTTIDGYSRGLEPLQRMGLDASAASFACWSLRGDIPFDDSVLFWHIATDIYLSQSKFKHEEKLVAAVKLLSNYMMFLVVAQPEMLPGPVRQGQYADTSSQLDRVWDMCLADQNKGGDVVRGPPQKWTMLKKLFQHDKTNNASRTLQIDELAAKLLSLDGHDAEDIAPMFFLSTRPFVDGGRVAKELLQIDSNSMLEVIFLMWVHTLAYAAYHCNRDSHARQLNNGGEFITIVWLSTLQQKFIVNQSTHDYAVPYTIFELVPATEEGPREDEVNALAANQVPPEPETGVEQEGKPHSIDFEEITTSLG